MCLFSVMKVIYFSLTHLFSLLQDMEALKRSLALIESKMAQAKSWLKDPHGQPGGCLFLIYCDFS